MFVDKFKPCVSKHSFNHTCRGFRVSHSSHFFESVQQAEERNPINATGEGKRVMWAQMLLDTRESTWKRAQIHAPTTWKTRGQRSIKLNTRIYRKSGLFGPNVLWTTCLYAQFSVYTFNNNSQNSIIPLSRTYKDHKHFCRVALDSIILCLCVPLPTVLLQKSSAKDENLHNWKEARSHWCAS